MYIIKSFKVLILFVIILASSADAQPYVQLQPTVNTDFGKVYYFLCPTKVGTNPLNIKPSRLILDSKGEVIYYKINYGGLYTGDFTLQPNGMMSYSFRGKFFLMDSTFTIRDSVKTMNGITADLHELQILPNGHFLLLGTEEVTMDLSSFNMFSGNGSPGSDTAIVTSGVIQELDENKNVIFEWHAWQYYTFDDVDEAFLNNPITVDWTHFNSLEFDSDGNLLVSSRHFNEITKIDHTTGDIIWRLGGKRNEFTFIGDSQQFKGQHDIRRIANGNITLFDNGNGNASSVFHPASAKEYHLDETVKTAELVWQFVDQSDVYSTALGNVQRLPDGHTLVNYGTEDNNSVIFNVVDTAWNKVFEISTPNDLISYRAFCYEKLPWELPRPIISCTESGGQFYLDAGPGYPAYRWSDGSTTQSIQVNGVDSFYVFVPIGQGGFIRSEKFVVINPENPCDMASVSMVTEPELKILPNPASDVIRLIAKTAIKSINVYDARGILVSTWLGSTDEIEIPCASLSNGAYYMHIQDVAGNIIIKRMIVLHP